MKIFQNKTLFKKLVIIFLVITLFSFCVPNIAKAASGVGGTLLDPLMSMFVGLGDGAISLLQKIVLHMDTSMIEVDATTKGISTFLGLAIAVAIIVVGVVAVIASPATGLAVVNGILTVFNSGVIAGVLTFCVSSYMANAMLPEDFVLPQIKISPYEIFANQIPLFDVDFFNPMKDIDSVTTQNVYQIKSGISENDIQSNLDDLRNRCKKRNYRC